MDKKDLTPSNVKVNEREIWIIGAPAYWGKTPGPSGESMDSTVFSVLGKTPEIIELSQRNRISITYLSDTHIEGGGTSGTKLLGMSGETFGECIRSTSEGFLPDAGKVAGIIYFNYQDYYMGDFASIASITKPTELDRDKDLDEYLDECFPQYQIALAPFREGLKSSSWCQNGRPFVYLETECDESRCTEANEIFKMYGFTHYYSAVVGFEETSVASQRFLNVSDMPEIFVEYMS